MKPKLINRINMASFYSIVQKKQNDQQSAYIITVECISLITVYFHYMWVMNYAKYCERP